MAKQGDWGGGGRQFLARSVNRSPHVTLSTVTEPEVAEVQGPAPKLKFYSQSQYNRPPFDPEFARLDARGDDRVTHGQ